jgi:hypothetical protein
MWAVNAISEEPAMKIRPLINRRKKDILFLSGSSPGHERRWRLDAVGMKRYQRRYRKVSWYLRPKSHATSAERGQQ